MKPKPPTTRETLLRRAGIGVEADSPPTGSVTKLTASGKKIPLTTKSDMDRIRAAAQVYNPKRKRYPTIYLDEEEMTVKPLRNVVMFEFLDSTGGAKGRFDGRKTESGIIIPTSNTNQQAPRWGKVLAVGPDAAVKPGEYIYIEGLMWMEGSTVDGVKMWKTDDTKILMVTDDIEDTKRTPLV